MTAAASPSTPGIDLATHVNIVASSRRPRNGPSGLNFTYALHGQKAMDARREAKPISGISASRATKQPRFLAATRGTGRSGRISSMTRPRHTPGMSSGSCLELRPDRLRRMRESKSDRLLANKLTRRAVRREGSEAR